jgi:hypothetical protein
MDRNQCESWRAGLASTTLFNMLQSIQTLATLPKNVTGYDTQPRCASVYSLSSEGKRKRSELAVAIDTEGVSLYDVSKIGY